MQDAGSHYVKRSAVNARSLAAADNHTTHNLHKGTCEGR